MYFTDEIALVNEVNHKDKKGQYVRSTEETEAFCNLTSITGQERQSAGESGHRAQARAILHIDDYGGQKIVRIKDGYAWLPSGLYAVYRTFAQTDTIELYLTQKEGVRE